MIYLKSIYNINIILAVSVSLIHTLIILVVYTQQQQKNSMGIKKKKGYKKLCLL